VGENRFLCCCAQSRTGTRPVRQPSAGSRRAVAATLALVGGLLLPMIPAAATTEAYAVPPGVHISCDINVVLTWDPAVTLTVQTVTADGEGWLGNKAETVAGTAGTCVSPDGTAAGITGTVGAIYPLPGAGGKGTASGPVNCNTADLSNGTGEIKWSDGSKVKFNWQFSFAPPNAQPTFTGQVTDSTASWTAPGDQFLVEPTRFTMNGGNPPYVDCLSGTPNTTDEFAGMFQLYTAP
jgi:hypothetical protein